MGEGEVRRMATRADFGLGSASSQARTASPQERPQLLLQILERADADADAAPPPNPAEERVLVVCFRPVCKNRSGLQRIGQGRRACKSRLVDSPCWQPYDGPRVAIVQ